MGCRGSFVIRENGINTYLYDRHFGAGIMPDIFYGVDSTLDMFSRAREDETILDEAWGEGGVIVDLDAKVMIFWGGDVLFDNVPLIPHLISFMETFTWQGWDVRHAQWGMLSMGKYLDLPEFSPSVTYQKPSKESREYHLGWWIESDRSSAEFNDEEATVISYKTSDGDILNYTTSVESESTLTLGEDLLQILKERKTTPLAHQRDVYDCLYIDEQNKTIHVFWGYPSSFDPLSYQLRYWSDWQVKWIDEGYVGHLKLIDYEQNDLLFSKEEAANGVVKIVKEPIERYLSRLKQKSEPDHAKAILHWENQLIFLEKLKQEWLEKTK
ncbi:MAG: hypothetical protein AAGF83_14925 [Cyanobacteria bacterium P01_G01_bin.67]